MIRINLLVSERASYLKLRQVGKYEVGLLIIFILLGVLLGEWWGSQLETQREILESQKLQKMEDWAHAKIEMGRLEKVTDRQHQLQETVYAFQAINASRMVPTMVLDIVSKELTPFSLWLTHVHLSDMKVLLEGEGLEKADIPKFIKKMQTKREFSQIQLIEIQGKIGERSPQFHFAITMNVVPDDGYAGTI